MRSIEIRTSQNVVIDYELAGLKDRFLAMFIDLIITTILTFIVLNLVMASISDQANVEEGGHINWILGFMGLVFLLGYHLICEITMKGQSVGKKAVGIKVVRLDGKEANLSDYLARVVFLLIDFVLSLGVLGALLISSSAKGQRLGDMTAHTTVIKIKQDLTFQLTDILKINTMENYTPKFTEVKSMSEKDMLLVKHALNRYRLHPNTAHRQAIITLYNRMCDTLDIVGDPKDKIGFLKTLLRDYIVLTR